MDMIAIVSIVAGIVTIIWFIWDINRRNGKLQKQILEVQKTSLEVQKTSLEVQKTSLEVQKTSLTILEKIEEGQRKGFETLANIQREIVDGIKHIVQILERINR